MERKALYLRCSSLYLLVSVLPLCVSSESHDAAALLALKSSVDFSDALPWRRGSAAGNVCGWAGVRECSSNGRVTKLVLEFLNLTGELPAATLASLDQLRVLSFKSNALSGKIPDVSALTNLKSLFLSNNRFSGRIPPSLSTLRRLKVIVLSGNMISGEIPASLAKLPKLYALLLQDNCLTGRIPAFAQMGLKFFNVSGNRLSGEIPRTRTLRLFNASSFDGNPNLCGEQLRKPCLGSHSSHIPPSAGPTASTGVTPSSPYPPPSPDDKRKKRIAVIVASSVGAFLFLAVLLGLAAAFFLFSRRRRVAVTHAASRPAPPPSKPTAEEAGGGGGGGGSGGSGGGVFSWDGEGLGKLVFCDGSVEMYTLEELLKAAAETLGRGTMGSTYKAVMESGFIVTVKRMKELGYPAAVEFQRRVTALGALRHPNLVPLRAYFQAREERLLVYDYFPNGSLFSLIHGSRSNGGGKPLHWTSCLKIAEDVAAGLLHLHQTAGGVVHGNLKSSNVLLGSDFESCLTDYALVPFFRSPDASDDTDGGASLFYRAPECRHPRRQPPTQQSDVYSFGVLLLELLTGKTPYRDLVGEHGEDVPRWVRSVREQEREFGEDPASSSGNEASEEKLAALVRIAAACVAPAPERRPAVAEVLRMVRDARAEVVASSNSSDLSPGRWSDAVQSLPREYGSDHINFAERD